jgi:hypothetical protein
VKFWQISKQDLIFLISESLAAADETFREFFMTVQQHFIAI